MNEGEQKALLEQVRVMAHNLERKLVSIGLTTVKVGLYDSVTRLPLNRPEEVVALAEGYCMSCVAGPRGPLGTPHKEDCDFNPKERMGSEISRPE